MPLYSFYYYAPARGTEQSLLITSLHAALARYMARPGLSPVVCPVTIGTPGTQRPGPPGSELVFYNPKRANWTGKLSPIY